MSSFDESEAFEAAASPSLSQMAMAARPTPYMDGLNPEQRAAVERLVRAVSARLRVNLLGIDVLPAVHGGLLIVDVNYFPVSTASFPSLPEALAEAVRDHAEQRQRTQAREKRRNSPQNSVAFGHLMEVHMITDFGGR